MNKKVFYSLVKTYKDSYKHGIMSHVPCSDEFFIKRLISKKTKQTKKKKQEKEKEIKKGLIPVIS